MALKATIFRALVNVADTDRAVYLDQTLTLARHPSETDERMMIRLLAWMLNADPDLEFTKGLCADDEPEIWKKALHGAVELWCEVGLPDEKRLRRACGRADKVLLYVYGARAAQVWWKQNKDLLSRLANLTIYFIPDTLSLALAKQAEKSMSWQVTISDGTVWLSDGSTSYAFVPERWQ